MRDPKAHAKVLALRWWAVADAQLQLRDKFGIDLKRWRRLARLRDLIHRVENAHRKATKWDYYYYTSANSPYWKYDGEIIPDTEEDA